tara:strand:- start:15392 stop:16249 length:858 start_codon:yes stop_codon:yes gene_type:complete
MAGILQQLSGECWRMVSIPLILLPPSEGKSSGGKGRTLDIASLSFSSLNETRKRMIKDLIDANSKPEYALRLLGLKGNSLETAKLDNLSVENTLTKSAIERYTGVMFDAICYPTLTDAEKVNFNESVFIMSGLFGMVRPMDMIPVYKLKMGAKLHNGKACSWIWKPLLTDIIAQEGRDRVIWDLLPVEHSAAWDPLGVNAATRFTVKFVQRRPDGNLKTVSHWSKTLKGALVRFLISNAEKSGSVKTAMTLVSGFVHPEGYELSEEYTVESDSVTQLVFVRELVG